MHVSLAIKKDPTANLVLSQGLENNDGIFMVASTNHLDKLDPGLSSRPSRFDRKYLFPNPSEEERDLYCQYWRAKLIAKHIEIEFPTKICPAVATITDGFSFAYMQEAFVASLLAIAQRRSDGEDGEWEKMEENRNGDGDRDLDDFELWREIKRTVKALRDDMGKQPDKPSIADDSFVKALALEKDAQAPSAATNTGSFPSTAQGQATDPSLLPTDDKPWNKSNDGYRVKGRAVEVDHQHVPIITDENTFVYK